MIKKELLGELEKLFIVDKRNELLGERTIKDYESNFRYFGEYLETRNLGEDIREVDFKSYAFWMKEEKRYSVSTINIRLSSLKCFLKWAYLEGHIKKDIASSLKKAKVDNGNIRALSSAEQKKFIKVCRVLESDPPITKRTKYFLLLIYYTGMRPNEVVNLKVEDINFNEEYINVQGETTKTGQTRKIATWDSNLENLLRDIISFNSSFDFILINLFFNLQSGEKVSDSTMRHNTKRYSKIWGLRNLTAYALRHTFAVNTQSIGMGHLKQAMGHKSIKSTEKYLNSTPKMVRDSFDNCKDNIQRLDYGAPVVNMDKYKDIMKRLIKNRGSIKDKAIKVYKIRPI